MGIKKVRHTSKFKRKIVLEALSGQKTISELASKNNVHPTQINRWRKQLENGIEDIFEKKEKNKKKDENKEAELFEQIGRLKFELEWLKKKVAILD